MFIFQTYADKSMEKARNELKQMETQLDKMVGKKVDPEEAVDLIRKYNQKVQEFNTGVDVNRWAGVNAEKYEPKSYSDAFVTQVSQPRKFEQSKETGTLDKTVIASLEKKLEKIKALEGQIADRNGRVLNEDGQDELDGLYTDYRRAIETYNLAVQTNNKYSKSKLKEYDMAAEPSYVLAGPTGEQKDIATDKYFTKSQQETEKNALGSLEAQLNNLKEMRKDATKKQKDELDKQIKKLENTISEAKSQPDKGGFTGPTLPGGFKTGEEYKDALKKLKGKEKDLQDEIDRRKKQMVELTKLAGSNDKTVAAVSMKKIQTLQKEVKEFEGILKDVKAQQKKIKKEAKVYSRTDKQEEVKEVPVVPLFDMSRKDEQLFAFISNNTDALNYFQNTLVGENYAKFQDYFGLDGITMNQKALQEILEAINAAGSDKEKFAAFEKYLNKYVIGKDSKGQEVYKGGERTYYWQVGEKGYTGADDSLLANAIKEKKDRDDYAKTVSEKEETKSEDTKTSLEPKTGKDVKVDNTEIKPITRNKTEKKEKETEKEETLTSEQEMMSGAADRIGKEVSLENIEEKHIETYNAIVGLWKGADNTVYTAYSEIDTKYRDDVISLFIDRLPSALNYGYIKNDSSLPIAIASMLKGFETDVKPVEKTETKEKKTAPKKEEITSVAFATGTWVDSYASDPGVIEKFRELSKETPGLLAKFNDMVKTDRNKFMTYWPETLGADGVQGLLEMAVKYK